MLALHGINNGTKIGKKNYFLQHFPGTGFGAKLIERPLLLFFYTEAVTDS